MYLICSEFIPTSHRRTLTSDAVALPHNKPFTFDCCCHCKERAIHRVTAIALLGRPEVVSSKLIKLDAQIFLGLENIESIIGP